MFWKNYSGADATAEILVMLLVSFLLGAALMYFYDKFLFDCVEEDDVFIVPHKSEIKEDKKREDISKETIFVKEVVETKNEDDLKIVEGIGPKIESILKSKGIETLSQLAETPAEDVRKILLEVGGERYAFHDPTTWGDQAQLAAHGNFDELKEYQDFLTKGRIA